MDDREIYAKTRAIMVEISNERIKAGYTQREFADIFGTSQGSLANMETARHNPTLRSLLRYADALDCELIVMAVKRKRNE